MAGIMKERTHPLYLIFQWHMHQPFYKDALSGAYLLPWTRCHITKDYTDMAWHLERYPEIKSVVNFVPSLLLQIRDYADLDSVNERHLTLTKKDAGNLTPEEQTFLLEEFFSANYKRIISLSPRYKELYKKRQQYTLHDGFDSALKHYTTQEYRDLQVWFLLAWTGQEIASHPEINSLIRQDQEFTEEDKTRVLEVHQEYIRDVIDRYKTLAESGQIELSISPYAHPILPLVIDSEVARICMPGLHLPQHRFRHPDEAERHVVRGLEIARNEFGWDISGMWPSEGSVSEETATLLAGQSLRWITSDSNVLARSLSRTGKPAHMNSGEQYYPYRLETPEGNLDIFFRDQMLSDLIGFQYANMEPADAAENFMQHLREMYTNLPDDDFPYVAVITMDGENAWEHFQENGKPFFDELYSAIGESDWLETTTFSEYLDKYGSPESLEWLHPGSWITADFHIWIGDREKNAAWDALNEALKRVKEYRRQGQDIPEDVLQALLQAEGSDWFWWYGDHNQSDHEDVFDLLFCNALRKVYQGLDEQLPPSLEQYRTLVESLG